MRSTDPLAAEAGTAVSGRLSLLLGLLVLALAVLGLTYCQGGKGARGEVRELKAEAKATDASVETSRQAAEAVDMAGADTRHRTEQARGKIRERIEADPRPAGRADPDVLRPAREAYERSVRAACGVQRTSDCTETAAAAGQ